jgi:hypothetical protein
MLREWDTTPQLDPAKDQPEVSVLEERTMRMNTSLDQKARMATIMNLLNLLLQRWKPG